MSDIEHGLKWWIRYVIVPLIGGGGAIAIVVAVINRPPQSPAQVVRGPDYNETPRSNPGSTRPTPTVHKTNTGPTRRQATAQPTAPEPSTSLVSQTANPISAAASPKVPLAEPVETGVFVTESYTLRAGPIRKVGDHATLPLILESTAAKTERFYMRTCYLLDENGARWDQKGLDSGGLTRNSEMVPSTKRRSDFTFVTAGDTGGIIFTFICNELHPENRRDIVLRGIPVR